MRFEAWHPAWHYLYTCLMIMAAAPIRVEGGKPTGRESGVRFTGKRLQQGSSHVEQTGVKTGHNGSTHNEVNQPPASDNGEG